MLNSNGFGESTSPSVPPAAEHVSDVSASIVTVTSVLPSR